MDKLRKYITEQVTKMLTEAFSKIELEKMFNELQPGEYMYIEDFHSNSYELYPGDDIVDFDTDRVIIKVEDEHGDEDEVEIMYNLIYKASPVAEEPEDNEVEDAELDADLEDTESTENQEETEN